MSMVIKVENLQKTYGKLTAVDGLSFDVQQGEIFGMVGPNGAGKTTTIECLEGLRKPDSGQLSVLGLDPWNMRLDVVGQIGVQLQDANLPARLRVGEALALFTSFYTDPRDPGELLERMGLEDKITAPIGKLSGGQKQRLFIALALLNRPRLVFLDELTTGLDPQARRSMWELVQEIRESGCTVFLTTHFMEEAERLCDRVAILDHGNLIALDTPSNLIRTLVRDKGVSFRNGKGHEQIQLERIPGVTRVEIEGDRLTVHGSGERFISSIVSALEDQKVEFRDLRTEQPTLEDVFLHMTGRKMRD
ncbi:MAG: ABC transporter ATP-binding protein [Anaerolineales bacterium]|nr:MAG: ABC transporter ATP-binding protein [Anaerolineales bacterium]